MTNLSDNVFEKRILYTNGNAAGGSFSLPLIQSRLQTNGYFLGNVGEQTSDSLLTYLSPLGDIWHPDYAVMTVAPVTGGQFVAQMDVEIRPHNECAYTENPPRYLALYCVSNEVAEGDFYLIEGREIIQQLTEDQCRQLREVLFACDPGVGSQFISPCLRVLEGQEYLIYTTIGCSEDWQENYYYQVVAGHSQRLGRALLDTLNQQLRYREYRYYHHWQAGELLIFDNWHFLHGREAFDGKQRELLHIRIR